MSDIKRRTEILFLYDVENANPNGDPNDDDKPRIDGETGRNIVTDVRLKRTIRDYIMTKYGGDEDRENKGRDVFVREKTYDADGHIQDAKLRAADYLPEGKKSGSAEEQKQAIAAAVLKSCIDIRMFGATIPLELKVADGKKNKAVKGSITYTGPIQFKAGKSMHYVKIQHVKGTGAFASKQGVTQKTFREEYMLPYSLIAFCGIINENAAKLTKLTEADVKELKEAVWKGTKDLISRSKYGQMPRLLMMIKYARPNFFMGDIDNLISLKSELREEKLRKPEDYQIDISLLMRKINAVRDKIEAVEFVQDDRMKFVCDGKPVLLKDIDKFKDISPEVL